MAETRLAIVTGGTRGIGFAIVKELCKKFTGTVCLTGRSESVCQQVVANLKKDGYETIGHVLEIGNQASIDAFADFIKKNYGGLDILVNNAAIAYKVAAPEPFNEQAENTIRINFFGTRNVCKALFPLLRPHARVVNLSSSSGMLDRIPGAYNRQSFLDPNLNEETLSRLMEEFVNSAKSGKHIDQGWGGSAYAVSKVGISALSFLQQKAFNEDDREDIIVNAVHPGYVATDMSSFKGPLSPEQGAVAPVYLALLPENVSEPKGQMVWYDKKVVSWTSDNSAMSL